MEIRQIRAANGRKPNIYELTIIARDIEATLHEIGFTCSVIVESPTRIRVSNVRLNTKVWGSTVSAFSGRASNCLHFYHWALVNYAINVILDKYGISAKVQSLKGLFVIRDGTEKKYVGDWEDRKWDNVGSVLHPVYRVDHWKPRDWEKFKKAFRNAINHLITRFGNEEYLQRLAIYVLSDPVYS